MAHIHLEEIDLTLPDRTIRWSLSPSALFKRWHAGAGRSALRGVSLRVEDGERLALVGPDGPAKSALLRVMAGLHHPDAGCLLVEGNVQHLPDGSPPLDPEASGWTNIERRHGPGEAGRELAAFTDLGEFLDLPVRCYSTGMRWRLEFTLATASEAEVLLVDGLIGGGDLAFRRRAGQRLQRRIERSRISVVASDDVDVLGQLCRRAAWLEDGRVREEGPVETVLAACQSRRSSLAA